MISTLIEANDHHGDRHAVLPGAPRRGAIVVMIAIPASLLVTLAAMRMLNFTLDTVSLLAMTFIIGILVDDPIVVLENIERHAEDGELPEVAADRGQRARTRHGGAGDHARRRRRLSADFVPAGGRRALSARVRTRGLGRNADVALRLVHGDAGARGALVAPASVETVADHRAFRKRDSTGCADGTLGERAALGFSWRTGASSSGFRSDRSCWRC